MKIIIILLLFVLSGCATIIGHDFNLENTVHISKGITTKQNLIKLFGEPRGKDLKMNNVEVWTYSYLKNTEKITGGSDNHQKVLIITLKNGIVVDFDKLEKFEKDVY